MVSVKMIFFDIDDTLLDYKTSQNVAAREFTRKYADHIKNSESFPIVWSEITARYMARYLSGELSFQEQRRYRVQDALGLTLSPSEADDIFSDYYQIYEASWQLFPDVGDVLKKLANCRLGIITNGDKRHQIEKLEKLDILSYFQEVITPGCAGAAKPELAIFLFAASRAEKPVDQCWYVGDNYKTDFCAAREAGFRSIWLNRSGHPEPCDSQCRDLLDFLHRVDPV